MKNLKTIFKNWQTLALAFAFLFHFEEARATHAAGADFTYRCLGGLQYELKLTFYRDCGGVAEPNTLDIRYYTKTGAYTAVQTVTATKDLTSGQEITSPCATATTKCNGGTYTGIRQWRYTKIVTLPGPAKDWVFSYTLCCRNCAITTINTPCSSGLSNLYVEATLNNLDAPCNNSPTFSSVPIAFVYVGQNFHYNHGVLDSDGDSLVYSLITPRFNATTDVSYIAPHNTGNPILSSTPFTIHPRTGDINFTPSQSEVGIMTVLVREYRNQKLIGSVLRDMQVYTSINSNNLPTASGINGNNNYAVTACANQPICFDIFTNDPDSSQNVTISTNSGIQGATYTLIPGKRPRLNFCWTPPYNTVGNAVNTFTLTVKDNACGLNGIQIFSYTIYIDPPYFNISSSNNNCYGANEGQGSVIPLSGGPYNYLWSNGATTQNNNNLYAGNYSVTVNDPGSGCSITTGITVTEPPDITLNTAVTNSSCGNVCNGSIDLSITGGANHSYLWSNGATVQDPTGICAANYSVTVTYNSGCTATASTNIYNNSPAQIFLSSTNVFCQGDSSGTISVHHLSGQSPYIYNWSNGQTTQNISGITIGNYTVTVFDSRGCSVSASTAITQYSNLVGAISFTSATIGNNGTASIEAFGGHPPYTYLWTTGATTTAITGLAPGTYGVTVTDSRGDFKTEIVYICTINTISSGSFIVNMGISPQTIYNGLKPYGLIADLVRNFNVPVKWVINNTKVKDGIDFNYEGIDYRGSAFIIESQYRTPAVNSVISGWQAQGVIGITTTSQISLPVYGIITTLSNLVIDQQNEQLVTPYFANAGIPQSIYTVGLPSSLNLCDDTYILPHADPTWATHSYLLTFNTTLQGFIWAGCHAVSVLEGINNPSIPTERLNFLTTTGLKCYGNNKCGSLITESHSGSASTPYTYSNSSNSHPIMQFMGDLTPSTENGSEKWYIPLSTGQWRTNTIRSIQTSDAAPPREGVKLAFGPGFGNNNNGFVMYEGGHSAKGTSPTDVAAQRTFFNFILQAGIVKKLNIVPNIPSTYITGKPTNISVTVYNGVGPYIYTWTSSCGGEFTDANSASTSITFPSMAPQTKCFISCVIVDACGRKDFISFPISSLDMPPAPYEITVNSMANSSCFNACNGAVDISVTGGTMPYKFNWSNGATTQNINNLCAGNYILTITDVNNCLKNDTIIITQPTSLQLSVSNKSDISCYGLSDGKIKLEVNGGTPPYSYYWSNNATTDSISNIVAGTYTATVSDSKGCTTQQTISITQPAVDLNAVTTTTNVLCQGNSTGSINIAVTGGTVPYIYNWSNGANTQNLNTIGEGTYTVTITDANACTIIKSAAISEPFASLTQTGNTNNVKCYADLTGNVNLTVNGGTAPYVYQWSNGTAGPSINNVAAGNYAVTISDANNCTSTATYSISQPTASLTVNTSSIVDVNCFGATTGAATASITGGTGPFSYLWSNGTTTSANTNIPAGTYTITVTDANTCTTTLGSIKINSPSMALGGSISHTDVKCKSGIDGTATVTANGGTPPYQYLWNNNATTPSISNLAEGTYTVTVQDSKSCNVVLSITVTEPTATLTISTTKTDINCIGNTIGSIDLSVSGGTPTYGYNWSNGSTQQDIINLTAGVYSVTVTDDNGCSTTTNTTITQPAGALTLNSNVKQVKCFGNSTGNIDITASAGTPPYTYSWSTGSSAEDLVNQSAGSYTLTLTDANGCILTNTIFITQPINALSITAVNQNVKCYGDPSGAIDITASGGTPGYTYLWNNSSSYEDLSGMLSGVYTVTVTDLNSCTASANFSISQPVATLSVTTVKTNLNCHNVNDGAINLTIIGGTSPYSYLWSNGSANEDLNLLSQGTYSVTITDANSCSLEQSISIQYNALPFTINSSVIAVKCFGNNTGSIDLTVNGGTTPYTYQWSNNSTTEDLLDLLSGTYVVTVTDVNGCTGKYTTSIQQPAAALLVNTIKSDELCHKDKKGTIDLSVSGGASPYTFNWSDGSTTEDLIGIEAGNYDVTVTDNNGCSWSDSFVINGPAAPLAFNIITDDPACKGNSTGSIEISPNGGTAPYQFTWSTGAFSPYITDLSAGIYIVTVTDTNQCAKTQAITLSQPLEDVTATTQITNVDCFNNSTGSITINPTGGTAPYLYTWSDGTSSVTHTQLTQGVYHFTVTDAHNCLFKDSATISQPTATLMATSNVTNVNCFNDYTGSIVLNVSGGTGPFSYQWNNGSTAAAINMVGAGTYTVTVTDKNNCTSNSSIIVGQPVAALAIQSVTMIDVKCHGDLTGSINLNVAGGTAPYSYNWFNGNTSNLINNVSAGTYNVLITDKNGCTVSANYSISEPNASLSISSAVTHVNCFGDNTGGINVTTSGGTTPFTYQWSNGTSNEDLLNSEAGTYSITITDGNQCVQNQTWLINQPSQVLANTFIANDVKCFGNTTGSLQAILTGGTAPFNYQWSNGQSTSQLSQIPTGIYILSVTDANGCKYIDSATVSQPQAALQSSIATQNLKCKNDQSGSINIAITGGTSNYTYLWSNGATTQNLTNLPAGIYHITIKDANNCSLKNTAELTQPSDLLTVDPTVNNVTCHGLNNGTITLAIAGGEPGYTIQWNTGANGTSINNLIHGLYAATVTDQRGCVVNTNINLQPPGQALALTVVTTPVNCLMSTQGSINTTVLGGNPPYQYQWSNGNSGTTLNQLAAGTYTVTITDLNGCSSTKTSTIVDESSLMIQANGPPEICIGSMITLSATAIPGVQYQWSYNNIPLNGATTNSFNTPVAGTYVLTATSNCGTYTSNPIQVTTRTLQNISVSNNFIICAGERAQLVATGGTKYSWDPATGLNDANIYNPVASPLATTNYTVTISDNHGCKANATVQVAVMCDTLNVPNGFSPNGDGTNDYFEIDGLSLYPENTLFIYNRWGNLIYKKHEYDNKWDGKSNVSGIYIGRNLPNGTYYYILDLKNDEKPLNGFVVIRR